MVRRHSDVESRTSLPNPEHEVESGKIGQPMRRREPPAISLGCRRCERLKAEHRAFSEAYKEFTRKVDLEQLAIDPDEIFAGLRDDPADREVNF